MSRRPKKNTDESISSSKNPTLAKLEALLHARGWSVYRLAKEADLPYTTLNNLFQRNTEPTLPVLRRICYGLQVPISEFFSDEELPLKQDYTDDEMNVITQYRKLEDSEQKLLKAYLHGLRRIRLKPGC